MTRPSRALRESIALRRKYARLVRPIRFSRNLTGIPNLQRSKMIRIAKYSDWKRVGKLWRKPRVRGTPAPIALKDKRLGEVMGSICRNLRRDTGFPARAGTARLRKAVSQKQG